MVDLPELWVPTGTIWFMLFEIVSTVLVIVHPATVATAKHQRKDPADDVFGLDNLIILSLPRFVIAALRALPVPDLSPNPSDEMIGIDIFDLITRYMLYLFDRIVVRVIEGLPRHKLKQDLPEASLH
jgi:hypothetical protein